MEENRWKMGETIGRLRRDKGLTQRELAECLGVSTAAVSKWETGRAWPEITLLCPLARALDTNVDTLLDFEQELTDRQAAEKIDQFLRSASQKGAGQAEQELEALLRRYPGCTALQYQAALAWDAFRLLFPDAEPQQVQRWAKRKKQLLEQVYGDKGSVYWQTAAVQLAMIALNDHQPCRAQQLLEILPQRVAEPELVWVRLYQQQNQPEKALETAQKQLFLLARQQLNCLAAMLDPALLPDSRRRLEVCRAYQLIDQLFGMGGLSQGLFLLFYTEEKQWEQAAQALEDYVQALLHFGASPNRSLFFPTLKAKEGNQVMGREMRRGLAAQLEQPDYQPLMAFPQAQRAIEALKASLE